MLACLFMLMALYSCADLDTDDQDVNEQVIISLEEHTEEEL